MSYTDFITAYNPTLLDISNLETTFSTVYSADLLIYGEIHGIKENADVVYTLAHKLGIKQLAVEASPSVREFIELAVEGVYDFSKIDTDYFDLSILSIEMIKTVATLLKEGAVEHVEYIDTYYDGLENNDEAADPNPELREQLLAGNLLSLDTSMKTLCIMGQWHTIPQPVELKDGAIKHLSALYRVRQVHPSVPFIHAQYKRGQARNDGRLLTLPARADVLSHYSATKTTDSDFEIHVPLGHPIEIPS